MSLKKLPDYRKKRYRMMYIALISLILLAVAATAYMNQPKFGRSPQGERLERMKKSPHYRDGMFHNQHSTVQITSGKGKVRTMFDFLFEKRERNRPDFVLPAIKTNLKELNPEEDLVVWFGHSSYYIQSGGKRLLVDPVFEDASPVSFFNKPFPGTDIYKADDMPDIDYLIITHDHWDHLDYKTVTLLRDRVSRVICPLGVGEHLEYWDFKKDQLVELDWQEEAILDTGFTVYCLPSRHFSGRTFKSNQTLWASFLLKTPTQYLYFSGDGGYDSRFAEIARRFPDIDVAILENGQYDKDWRYIHLMPEDLEKAIQELHPKKVFTGHNGKYALARHPWDEPLNNIAAAAEKDSFNLFMPVIGEIVRTNSELKKAAETWWEHK